MATDPVAAFDEAAVDCVAREFDASIESVWSLVRRHQELVRRLPGVDNIVYEWRNAFETDPVVERTVDAYYLAVAPSVWPEYVSALSLTDEEAALLRAVHRRQLERGVSGETEATEAMVLTRE